MQPNEHSRPIDAAPPCAIDAAPGRVAPRWKRMAALLGLAIVLVIGAGALIAVSLSHAKPNWWRRIDPKDPLVEAAALRVENGAATQLSRVRPTDRGNGASDPWTIKVSSADANAWLASRLRPWLESRSDAGVVWPKELEGVEVRFEAGSIRVGACVRKISSEPDTPGKEPETRIISASLRPEFRADGSLWLPATGMAVGRLSVPRAWLIARAAPRADTPGNRDLIAAVTGACAAMRSPIITIGDGRRVRLLKLDAEGDALYITCRTLARETVGADK
jgi:hypothetical protein